MILVTGAKGLLGSALCGYLATRGEEFEGWDLPEHDLTDMKSAIAGIEALKPDFIFHLAAWTDVDGCELDRARAYRTNILATWGLALAAANLDLPLLYMSSDYVFGGDKGEPYLEYDEPNPVNYYGWTKLIGEQIVAKRLKRSFIVRTCGLYGPKGKNFVATVLLKARQGETLKMVSDQWVSPTYTADIVPFLFELSHSKYYGIYHLTNQGCITWYEFAKEILKRSRRPYELWGVSSEELGRPARRPRFSALKNQNFEVVFGHQPREWTSALEDYLKDTGQG